MSSHVDLDSFWAAVTDPAYDDVTWDSVRKTTVVKAKYVDYTVHVEGWRKGSSTLYTFRVYEATVSFGNDVARRAGGRAFVEAAAEQEKAAAVFVDRLRSGEEPAL